MDAVPFPRPYGYRVRVQLKAGKRTIGYYQEKSRRIVDISYCPISHPLVNRIISILRDQRNAFPDMEEIEINVSPEEEKGALLFHPRSHDQRFEHFARQLLQAQPVLKGIAISGRREWTPLGDPSTSFTVPVSDGEEERSLSFQISPGSFSQVNFEQNEKLIRTVVEFSGAIKTERILDLYAGVGNFTLPLAIHAEEVWGIEENRVAVKDGKFNAERNGILNARFIEGAVEKVLKDWNKGKPDQIILDPPRAGCKRIVDLIAGLKPKKIICVSCEPTTLSRDLRLFIERGFSVERIRLIDMFPQTYHMEVVGLLQQS